MEARAQKLMNYLNNHLDEMISDLELLTRAQSSSTELNNLENCAVVLKNILLKRLDGSVKLYPQKENGSHLCWTSNDQNPQHILVIGHYDTVWPENTIPLYRNETRLFGPGVLDMKSGIITAIWAVCALREIGEDCGSVVLAFNSDEEIGSPSSRTFFAELAKDAKAVLVCEPVGPDEQMVKTARKGSGTYKISFEGLSSHAGNDYWDGINAIEQMARTIHFLHSLSDKKTGTTVNVGTCFGGRSANVISDYAEIEVDTRYVTIAEQERTHQILMGLTPSVSGVKMNCICISLSPPMENNLQNQLLFDMASVAGEKLGLSLKSCFVGGASDGNYLSAMNIPTLDGLGGVGEGAHALHEQLYLDKWPIRVALLAEIIARLNLSKN